MIRESEGEIARFTFMAYLILGFACLAMLGFTFLLLESGHWRPFLSVGAGCCAIGLAASGLSAYYNLGAGPGCSLAFASPVLLVGAAVSIPLLPRVGLPSMAWFAFGVLMFVASWTGGRIGAACRSAIRKRRFAAKVPRS
jgi:hypothetical protein